MSYSSLIATVPKSTNGFAIRHARDGFTDWRFVVEIALPFSSTSLLGTMILGTDVLSSISTWTDISGDVEYCDFAPGGDERPEYAPLNLKLRNVDEQYDPSASSYFGPGTYIRLGIGRGNTGGNFTTWIPVYTGVIRTWQTHENHTYGWVDITASDVTVLLSRVDENAVTLVGSGDTLVQRLDRLIAAAGLDIPVTDTGLLSPFATYEFQSTDMANNRLAEMYVANDSVDATMFVAGDGEIKVFHPQANYASATVYNLTLPIVKDSLQTLNDDELIISKVLLSQVGGTQYVDENTALTNRYAKKTYPRSDLMTRDIYSDADLAALGDRILARSAITYRPSEFTLDINHGSCGCLTSLKIGDTVSIFKPFQNRPGGALFKNFPIKQMTHTIYIDGDLQWTCVVEMGVDQVSTVEIV